MTLLTVLRDKIKNKQARLAVIGLGYVGLPVACEFASVGFDVLGVELRVGRVDMINAGQSPIDGNEPGLEDLLARVVNAGKLRATADYQQLRDRDIVLIDVETPVDEDHIPRYETLRDALHSLGPVLKDGALVIVESTISPGTMDQLVLPLLVESSGRSLNSGFFLGICPERVMPGKLLANLRHVSRVVGGMSSETAEVMKLLYGLVVEADLDIADCVTAELVKTTENAYRDVQIAFANEVALICEAVGGDVWKVRELVNKSPFRNMHLPGAGVGGHCIPKDPWLLAYGANGHNLPLRIIPSARSTNDSMPFHMADLLQDTLESLGCKISDARILIMGYTYMEDSDDTRNSSSQFLAKRLHELGAQIVIHDPFVPEYQADLAQLAAGCDAAVVMVRHKAYQQLDLSVLKSALRTPLLIDGRRVFNATQAQAAGLVYRLVGAGVEK